MGHQETKLHITYIQFQEDPAFRAAPAETQTADGRAERAVYTHSHTYVVHHTPQRSEHTESRVLKLPARCSRVAAQLPSPTP